MTSQFMNFESAAEKMGDMSALFGIQMDAMEMTYLANEDQEEFLMRMREEVLDAGLDVENMSQARQKALTEQLGLNSIEQMKQFMDTGITMDQAELTGVTDEAQQMDGMANAIDNFGGAFEGAYRDSADFKESLRNQARYTDEIATGLVAVREEAGKLPEKIMDFQVPKDAIENAQKLLGADMKMVEKFNKDLIPVMKDMAQGAADGAAALTKTALEAAGIENLKTGGVKVTGTVETQINEQGSQQAERVILAAEKTNEQSAKLQTRTEEIADSQLSLQGDVTSLIEQQKANKNINMSLQLNARQLGSEVWKVIQEKYDGNIVINPNK